MRYEQQMRLSFFAALWGLSACGGADLVTPLPNTSPASASGLTAPALPIAAVLAAPDPEDAARSAWLPGALPSAAAPPSTDHAHHHHGGSP